MFQCNEENNSSSKNQGYNKLKILTFILTFVLDTTLKGIRGVRLDNRKVFFVHYVLEYNILSAFMSFNKQ